MIVDNKTLFYKNLKLFLKDLIIVFPEDDEDLQTITTSINLAMFDDNDKIILKFYNSLQPLEQTIYDRNETVFYNELYWDPSSYEHQLFTKIKNNWGTFSDHNKKIIWDYIHVLYCISNNYIN